jgi:hypothetical protein
MYIQQNIDKRLAAERMSNDAGWGRFNQAGLSDDDQSDEELKRINASNL